MPTPNALHGANRFNLLTQIGATLQAYPQLALGDALSHGQMRSKRWLIEELEALDLPLGTIFLLGGWWGLLSAMFFESALRFERIRSFDIDPTCAPIAESLNRPYVKKDWAFKAATADMLEINYSLHRYQTARADGSFVDLAESPDTLVNTSCEHLPDFAAWWERVPAEKLLVLQSNDFFAAPAHVNSVPSLEAFATQTPLARTLFSGELALPDYKRFMRIGYKG